MMVAEMMEAKPQVSASLPSVTVLADTTPSPGWAEAVALADGWNPLFSSAAWAHYLQRWAGCEPRFVSVYAEHGARLATWMVFLTELSTFRRGWKRFACRPLKKLAQEAVWFAPPALRDPRDAAAVSCALVEFLQRTATQRPFLHVAGGPWLPGAETPFRTVRWATYIVDCQGSEEALWRRLKPSARKSIRKAQDRGLTVRRLASREEMPPYIQFAKRAARASGRTLSGQPDLLMAWDCLREQACLEFFVAELRGECVSALGVRGQGVWVSEFGSYQSLRDRTERLHAQDLIKWEVIRWARRCGLRYMDLAGVNPEPATAKERGIRQFKEKWGGRYVEFPQVQRQWVCSWARRRKGVAA